MNFVKKDTLIYRLQSSNKRNIAAFDLDGTIIKTKSGNKFAKDKDDWKFLYPNTKEKLNEIQKTHRVVIFTNQKGISKGKISVADIKHKINNIKKELGFDFDVFISTADDYYRKPMIGMWDVFESNIKKYNEDNSFYVGDAAGRDTDFSISDYYFAYNINIDFMTPEKFFLNNKMKIKDNYFDHDNFVGKMQIPKPSINQEMIIMVGRQGSGKSYVAKKYKNYGYVNQDQCKTKAKCLKLAKQFIMEGKSVIIDNTNPSNSVRQEYIDLGIPYRIFLMNTPENICKHMNQYRAYTKKVKAVPIIAYRIFNKKYEKPRKNVIEIEWKYEGKDDAFWHKYIF